MQGKTKSSEDAQLAKNIETQQSRLLKQLEDLEELKEEADLSAEEME